MFGVCVASENISPLHGFQVYLYDSYNSLSFDKIVSMDIVVNNASLKVKPIIGPTKVSLPTFTLFQKSNNGQRVKTHLRL